MKSFGKLAALCITSLALGGADWPGRARELVAQLGTAPPARRSELLAQLAPTGSPEADAAVVRALADPDPAVRMTAADLVARYRVAAARDVLTAWLGDPQADVRAVGARALGAIGDFRAMVPLVRLLGDADVHVRLGAVDAVAAIGGPEATVPLLDRLADGEATVRVATARALGDIGDPRAVLSLLGTLQDSTAEVRSATATALGRLRDARAVRGLVGLIRDPQLDVRAAAVRALGTLGAPAAVVDLAPFAVRAGPGGDPMAGPQLARLAVDAIGRIGGPDALAVLVRTLRRSADDADARPAADALRGLGDAAQAAIPALVEAPIPGATVRTTIALLGDLGGDAAAQALMELYASADGAWVAQPLLRALGQTGAAAAQLALLRAAAPTDAGVPPGDGPRADAATASLVRRGVIAGLLAYGARRGGLDPEALDPLVQLLAAVSAGASGESGDQDVASVARLIGLTHNPRAAGVLGPLLATDRVEVRVATAAALAQVGVAGVEARVAAALADAVPEVRLGAADALGRFGDRAALDALLAVWVSPRPIDRADAARAVGRIAARTGDPRAAVLLTGALGGAAPALAAALLDGLGFLARSGDPGALRGLARALENSVLAPAAAEALANAAASASDAARATLGARLAALASAPTTTYDDVVRATAVWGLGHVPETRPAVLLAALGDPSVRVATNAAGALARVFAAGAPPPADARDVLCSALERRRQPMLRANVLLAVAGAGLVCSPERQRQMLFGARSPVVRRAAAESLAVAIRSLGAPSPALRGALEGCATAERATDVAQRCRALLAGLARPPAPAGAPVAAVETLAATDGRDAIDAVVLGDDEQAVAVAVPIAVVMADGVVRVGTTGPAGWIHERPAPVGSYTVLDPEAQPLEP